MTVTYSLLTAYALGVASGVIICHRVSLWWRWGDRGAR